MPNPPLTELTIRKLQLPSAGQITVWDSVPGFGIRISQGGSKTFIVLLGAGSRHTIGRYPIITLADARKEAKRILAERTLGKHRPKSISFDAALALFLAACKQKNRSRTVADYTRLLKRHFAFGRRQLSDITTQDVTHRLDRLSDTPSEQNHALVAIKIFFRWALRRRYIDHSPCEGLLQSRAVPRERVLVDSELAAVYRSAEGYPFGAIVRLLVLTGQRRGEIGSLKWDWIDTNARTITLPSSTTKNKRTHTFPYSDIVAGILEAIPRQGDYVFPASREHVRGKPTAAFNGYPKAKAVLDAKSGVSNWTLHDLRRTFSTIHAAIGTPPHITERLLNHASGVLSGVAAIYNRHAYIDEMRAAIGKYEGHLRSFLPVEVFVPAV